MSQWGEDWRHAKITSNLTSCPQNRECESRREYKTKSYSHVRDRTHQPTLIRDAMAI